MHNKKLLLLIAITYTIALAVFSLMSNDNMPYFGTNYEDKVYHLLAYGLLTLLWHKVLIVSKSKNAILVAFVVSIIYGTVIEVLQGSFTVSRDPSGMDIVANGIGTTIVTLILILRKKTIVKKI